MPKAAPYTELALLIVLRGDDPAYELYRQIASVFAEFEPEQWLLQFSIETQSQWQQREAATIGDLDECGVLLLNRA